MLGYLLARAGVRVTVLEKHNDFFRDFRGDTVHPSTLGLFDELGLLDEFLRMPHQTVRQATIRIGDFPLKVADLSRIPARCRFIALMPQWDFLNFLSAKAKQFPGFDLRMNHQAVGLLREGGKVTGVRVRTPQGEADLDADLVVGCDGRHSTIRAAEGFELIETGVPIDVLWFRVPRETTDPEQLFGSINYGNALIMINRGDYFQAAYVIRKGSFEALQAQGVDAFQNGILRLAPYLGERVRRVNSWDQVKLLSVQINHLTRWYAPGLLCIGDAAHAMSPVGGVGINLAIQDAVAAAHFLAEPLRQGSLNVDDLRKVQRRREFPARATQLFQVNAHKGLSWVFSHPGQLQTPPTLVRSLVKIPGLSHVTARALGIGVRPEHIAGPAPSTKLVWLAAAAVVASLFLRSRTS